MFCSCRSDQYGGFAWEFIESSLEVNEDDTRVPNAEFHTVRNNAMAVIRGEQTLDDVASYVQDIDLYGNMSYISVAFLVMAAKHMLNEDVTVQRYNNNRYRGWVIRPAINNPRAIIETKRHGATYPAVAIVTDKNYVTHFMAFENCWEANFEGISNWKGAPFDAFSGGNSVDGFVTAIRKVVDAFNSKNYYFLAPRD